MRVAYVCTDAGVPPFGRKGASVHVQAILTQLLDRGDEVHLITPRPGSVPARLAGIHLHPLADSHHPDAAIREVAARAMDATITAILDQLQAEARVDLVYERYALWGRTAMSWARTNGVASVLEVNAPLPDEQARHRVLVDTVAADAVARAATADAEVVVCVSAPVAHWVRGLGSADPRSIHVVPNGVDTRRFTPAEDRARPSTFTVGFVGTLKPWHGVEDLVRAVALLHQRDPSYRLLVVGEGPERAALERLVDLLGLVGAVEFTGAVVPDDVPAHLARMDVGVAPYPPTEDFYFSPLKIYEYLAAGLPVVASDLGSVSELLTGTQQPIGVLYPAGSVEDLATTVARLRHDPITRVALGRRGRRAAIDRHDWKHVLERILDRSEVLRAANQAS